MCRGFVGINLDSSIRASEDIHALMLNYMDKSYSKNNTDGFFFENLDLEGHRESLRTLNIIESLDFIHSKRKDLKHVVHGHARWTSVGGTTEGNVHGWQYKGYSCSMNGTFDLDKKFMTHDTDSQSFFEMAFAEGVYDEDLELWMIRLKSLAEKTINYGNGGLFFVGPEYTIVLSVNKKVNYHLMNDRIIILNTNDDIHTNYNDSVKVKIRKPGKEFSLKMGELSLKPDTSIDFYQRYPCNLLIESDYSAVIEDSVALINNLTGNVEKIIDIEKIDTATQVKWSKNDTDEDWRNQYPGYSTYKPTMSLPPGKKTAAFDEVDQAMINMATIGELVVKLVGNGKTSPPKDDVDDAIGLANLFDVGGDKLVP